MTRLGEDRDIKNDAYERSETVKLVRYLLLNLSVSSSGYWDVMEVTGTFVVVGSCWPGAN